MPTWTPCAPNSSHGAFKRIDDILSRARLTNRDIELCLATGGMVHMPTIADGLFERFVGRVADIDNGDRIIAEGAAWIAHDGLRLRLSKSIGILVADSSGRGSYHRLVEAGFELPVENETKTIPTTRLYCVDPREGVAVVEIAKPDKVGLVSPTDPRSLLCSMSVPVDPKADPPSNESSAISVSTTTISSTSFCARLAGVPNGPRSFMTSTSA